MDRRPVASPLRQPRRRRAARLAAADAAPATATRKQRGHVLVLGGSREMPGAVILAATAAMRAGAGKLTIATGASVAQLVAMAIPEARVLGLPETEQGGFTAMRSNGSIRWPTRSTRC